MATAPEAGPRIDLGRSAPALAPAVLRDGTPVGLTIFAGALRCYHQDGSLRWESHPPGLNYDQIIAREDLDGDGNAEVLLQAGRPTQPFGAAALVSLDDGELLWKYDVEPMSYAWYLYADSYWPNDTKKQIVVLMHAYPPDKDNGYIALFAFEGRRAPAQKWRYAFHEYTCFPTLLRNDLDGDGVNELVVETHSRMWHLDAFTGAVKHYIHWDVSPGNERSYGLVKFTDVNKDDRDDFLCIATFAQHHEVLLNTGGKFEKAWGYGWSESVTVGKVATTYPEVPDVDVDGDGSVEIVVSMFNSENDQAWLLRVYDATSGALKYRVPGIVAVGAADLNEDGAAELLVNKTGDPARAKTDGAQLITFKGGALEIVWSDDTAEAIPPSKKGDLRVRRGDRMLAVRIDPSDTVSLEEWAKPQKDRPDFSKVPAIVGPPMPKLLAADVTNDGRNDVIVYQEPTARVFDLRDGAFELVAEFSSSCLPVIADMNGDNRLDVVTADVAASRPPIVEVKTLSADPPLVWKTELPPATRRGLPHGRAAYLRTARFTGGTTPDLYLYAGTPLVRSAGINGKTGTVLWEKDETPGIERYWAPTVNAASTWDFDGDGKDDLVFTNPDYYCVAAGLSGETLLGPLQPQTIFKQPSQGLYTLPAILDRQQGEPLVALVAGHYFQAAMTVKAEPLWHAIPRCGEARSAEEGFIRAADGAWLMGFGRQNGMFACVEVATGRVLWEYPLEASCSDVAGCDIDADGRAEFVFGTSHGKLIAIGDDGGKARLVWETKLPAALGAPILADITGDGRTDILIPGADGYITVFSSPKP